MSNQNENPGATAIATGAKDVVEGVNSYRDITPNRDQFASKYPILAEHWGDDLAQRVERAIDALSDLALWQAEMIACGILGIDGTEYAGMPQAPLFSHMDQATFWADMAAPVELDAYCLASFNRMAPARQAAFLGFVQEERAA